MCIASSNGGTTSQDLKTGFLVGATPRKQQLAIVVGAVTSALVIGVTMLALNSAGVHYTTKGLPKDPRSRFPPTPRRSESAGPTKTRTTNEYRVVHVIKDQYKGLEAGRYLVDDEGWVEYRTDIPIAQKSAGHGQRREGPRRSSPPRSRNCSR